MNTTDKIFIGGITTLAAVGYLYISKKQKAGYPAQILGLNTSNSKKFTMAVAGLGAAVLIINAIKTQNT